MTKKTPLKATFGEIILSILYGVLSTVLWIILLFGAFHLLLFYKFTIGTYGFFSEQALKICIYLIVGSYFFLILNRNDVKKIFKVKNL